MFYKGKPDIIIKNGTIVDGTGAPAYFADIAIVGDKIDYIGDLEGVTAPLVIDAHHKYVTPGFIDPHSHVDFTMWANPENGNYIHQGITTAVAGNCGYSMRHYLAGIPFDPAGDSVKCVYDYAGADPSQVPKGAQPGCAAITICVSWRMYTAWKPPMSSFELWQISCGRRWRLDSLASPPALSLIPV